MTEGTQGLVFCGRCGANITDHLVRVLFRGVWYCEACYYKILEEEK